jgi:hypothetical protein
MTKGFREVPRQARDDRRSWRVGILTVLVGLAATFANAGMPIGDDKFGALRAMEPADPLPPAFPDGRFLAREGETIVLLGGTNVVEEQFSGYFETALQRSIPDQQLLVRNLAWQADTVYRQQRPLYFFDAKNQDKQAGSTHDQRKRVQPGAIFARFGKMESLDGLESLPKFREAYGGLLDEMMKLTPRIVVVSPTPFFKSGPAAAQSEERNKVLVAYCLAMSELAGARSIEFLDLYQFEPDRPYSDNGVHLNDLGQREIAKRLIHQLSGEAPQIDFDSVEVEELRQAVVAKNKVWHQFHRPSNWAFLYGDRQHVPSSRDHKDPEKRWFPFEVDSALTSISKMEAQIHELAK